MALYWAPEDGDPLGQAGESWLRHDPPGMEGATSAPRHYGFHATLRPPMRLATRWPDFMRAAETVAARIAPSDLPALHVEDMDGYLALGTSAPNPALQELADACIIGTDAHRRPAGAAELARRRAAGLTAAQDALLLQWGYPYVLGEWRFHMTLTRRLSAAEMQVLRPRAEAHFAAALAQPRRVASIAVFTQTNGGPFSIAQRLPLQGN